MTAAHVCEAGFCAVDLDRSECLALFRSARIGRVVLSIECVPVALPVNVWMFDEDVMLSIDSGSKLTAAVDGQVVSVETDEFDLISGTGWSVLVTGVAQLISDAISIEWTDIQLPTSGPHPFWVRVPPTLISGRRLTWDAGQSAE